MTDRKDMDRATPPAPNEGTPRDATTRSTERRDDTTDHTDESAADAVRRHLKYGSAGSGGAEYEPGTPRQE